MWHNPWLAGGLVAVIIVGLGALLVSQFSPEAKLRRRRRKNHGRLIAKTGRPTVRFSVKAPKE